MIPYGKRITREQQRYFNSKGGQGGGGGAILKGFDISLNKIPSRNREKGNWRKCNFILMPTFRLKLEKEAHLS